MIIALTGYARSGKDTVGRMLVEHHGFKRKAFADKLKQLAIELDPFLDDARHGRYLHEYKVNYPNPGPIDWEHAKTYVEVREFLQNLGVAARNVLGPDVWVEAVIDEIIGEHRKPGEPNYVITDVRFVNEADALRNTFKGNGWGKVYVVRIVRPGYGPVNDHVSETELDSIRVDHTLVNDGDLYDLERKVRSLVIDDTVYV